VSHQASNVDLLAQLTTPKTAFAAPVNQTVDTVTDTEGGSRVVNWNDGTTLRNNAATSGTAAWQNNTTLTNNEQYANITLGQYQRGYVYLTSQFSGAAPWSVEGHLAPRRIAKDSEKAYSGDWLGAIVGPVDPSAMLNGDPKGESLGIKGIANAYGFGIDMFTNTGDPGIAPLAGWRSTDANGNMISMSRSSPELSQDDVSAWNIGSASTDEVKMRTINNYGLRYTISWTPSADGKTGTLTGTFYDVNGTQKFTSPKTINNPGYFSVALNASTGQSWQELTASFTKATGTINYSKVNVKYVDANGAEIRTGTSFNANVGHTVGMTGLSPNAASDNYSYNAPSIPGYYARSANDVTVSSTSANTMTVVYAKEPQQVRLITNQTDPNGAAVVENRTGVSGDSISFTSTDATLTRRGYNYTITAPNGQTYTSLSAAAAAAIRYDNSVNNGGADTAVQTYTVSYTPSMQQARLVDVSQNVLATATGTTGAAIGSFPDVTDATLARPGYTYKIVLPDGTLVNTLAQALSGKVYDNTQNATGATTDSAPQIFTVEYTADYQEVNIVTNNDPRQTNPAPAVIETITGRSDASITTPRTTDSSLTREGYTYTVSGPDGTTYNSLSAALAANRVYDRTPNGAQTQGTTPTDAQIQSFTVTYTPLDSTLTYNYVILNEDGTVRKVIKSPTAGPTGKVGQATPDAEDYNNIPGYRYVQKSVDSDLVYDPSLVSTVTYVYEAIPQTITIVYEVMERVDPSDPNSAWRVKEVRETRQVTGEAGDQFDISKTTTSEYPGYTYDTRFISGTFDAVDDTNGASQTFTVRYYPQDADVLIEHRTSSGKLLATERLSGKVGESFTTKAKTATELPGYVVQGTQEIQGVYDDVPASGNGQPSQVVTYVYEPETHVIPIEFTLYDANGNLIPNNEANRAKYDALIKAFNQAEGQSEYAGYDVDDSYNPLLTDIRALTLQGYSAYGPNGTHVVGSDADNVVTTNTTITVSYQLQEADYTVRFVDRVGKVIWEKTVSGQVSDNIGSGENGYNNSSADAPSENNPAYAEMF
jgi:hypothetical protein